MKRIFSTFISYFFRGLLLTVPAAVTIFVIVRLFFIIDDFFKENLDKVFPDLAKDFPLYTIPGLGLLALVVLITILGVFGSSILVKPVAIYFEAIFERVPLIKTIYSAIKDLLSAFVGSEKRFDQPVLVRLSQSADVEKLGFITKKDLTDLGIGEEKVAVYLPHSYAWSGNLYIVPEKNVRPLDTKAADVMKFIVSGGVSDVSPTNGKNKKS